MSSLVQKGGEITFCAQHREVEKELLNVDKLKKESEINRHV